MSSFGFSLLGSTLLLVQTQSLLLIYQVFLFFFFFASIWANHMCPETYPQFVLQFDDILLSLIIPSDFCFSVVSVVPPFHL